MANIQAKRLPTKQRKTINGADSGKSGARRMRGQPQAAAPRLILSPSRDIPFEMLRLSQSNVRRIKADVSIEELAANCATWAGRLCAVDEDGIGTAIM
jgi:hypothetical protein